MVPHKARHLHKFDDHGRVSLGLTDHKFDFHLHLLVQ